MSGTPPVSPMYWYGAQDNVAELGTTEQRRRLIQNPNADLGFFFVRFRNIKPDLALIPTLKEVFKSKVPKREYAIFPLVNWLPENEAEAFLTDAIQSDAQARTVILKEMQWPNAALKERIFLCALNQPDSAIRREALMNLGDTVPSLATMKRLLEMLSGNDLPERRGAALALWGMLNEAGVPVGSPGGLKTMYEPANPAFPVETGGAPAAETDAERETILTIREAAERYLLRK